MKLMNKLLYTVFAFQLIIVSAFATLSLFWMRENSAVHSYLNIDQANLGSERWFI